MTTRRRTRRTQAQAAPAAPQPGTGRARYTVERFLSCCAPSSAAALRSAWSAGDQLAAARVPTDALPVVTILAAYAYVCGVGLVDDFDRLMERQAGAFSPGMCAHPDKYLASCCVLLWRRGLLPTMGAFEDVNVPAIYEELLG